MSEGHVTSDGHPNDGLQVGSMTVQGKSTVYCVPPAARRIAASPRRVNVSRETLSRFGACPPLPSPTFFSLMRLFLALCGSQLQGRRRPFQPKLLTHLRTRDGLYAAARRRSNNSNQPACSPRRAIAGQQGGS